MRSPAPDRPAGRGEEILCRLDRERVARVVACEGVERQRGVLHRAADRALEHEGRDAGEGVGTHDDRHATERRLETEDIAPGGRNADRTAGIGPLREGNEPVRDGPRAAARGAAGVFAQVERIARRRSVSCRCLDVTRARPAREEERDGEWRSQFAAENGCRGRDQILRDAIRIGARA